MDKLRYILNITGELTEDLILKEITELKRKLQESEKALKEKEDSLKELAVSGKELLDEYDKLLMLNEGKKLGDLVVNKLIRENDPLNKMNWTYSEWEKKDPKGLTEMYKNNKGRYDLLLNKWKNK